MPKGVRGVFWRCRILCSRRRGVNHVSGQIGATIRGFKTPSHLPASLFGTLPRCHKTTGLGLLKTAMLKASSGETAMTMAAESKEKEPITIKKYANRRLYNTGTSTYVTLEDLAAMVKAGEDFVVYDAKTNEDITRSVLTQIIFEQENKEGGQNLLPINFLRQLIRFYGDSMQMLVPRYLEVSIDSLTKEQSKFREQISQAFGMGGFGAMEDQVRRNMEMFERTFAMFAPFARQGGQSGSNPADTEKE